jgi:hypothetical protein
MLSTNRLRLDSLACHFGTFPALSLLNVGKVSCGHNAVIQVKGVFSRMDLSEIESFGVDVRQVRSRSALLCWILTM